jgi:hypothetical protein
LGWSAEGASQERQTNIVDQIQGIEETRKATVVLLPPDFMFSVIVTEANLGGLGCHYVADDPSRIRSLFDILRRGDLSSVESVEAGWMNEPREGISLESPNGDRIVFLFTIDFIDQGVRGYFYRQSQNGGNRPLTVDPPLRSYLTPRRSLPNELMVWALGVGASIPSDLRAGDQMKQACDYFVKKGEILK